MARPAKLNVPARIVLMAPPPGPTFALQRGKGDLAGVAVSTGQDLQFDFVFQAVEGPGGRVRFSGEFVQGPAGGKFIYVNSGTLAGDPRAAWTRRAKVSLESLTWAAVSGVAARPGLLFEARISGVAKDGGPACASVPLLNGGWQPVGLT
jgi:hypothetical protein